MGNEQKIIEKIIEDANKKAAEIIDNAKKDAEALLDKKKTALSKEAEAFSAVIATEAEKAYSKEISGAERRGKQTVLMAKQEMIKLAFESAKEKLLNMEGEEYKDAVSAMLLKAAMLKGALVLVNEKDKSLLAPVIEKNGFKLSDKSTDIEKGFIIKKGDIEYNYSFLSILAIEREEIEKKAAEILFV